MTDGTKKKIVKWFWILVLAPFVFLSAALLLVWAFARIPSFEELEHPDSKQSTQVIADDGTTVLTTFHIENRTYVDYSDISPNAVNAAVATEDIRFYKHSGIDFKGLARVFVKTLLLHNSSQGGGSTITQQLAKTLYPRVEVNSKIPGARAVVMVWTKLKEWITAVKIERNYTKDEIMQMYLNSIFFGSSAYGIQTAAETFFAKAPSDLTVEEAATLIGMVNKPTRYNPNLNPEESMKRRNFVIGQMAKAKFITKAERDSLVQLPIELHFQLLDHNSGLAPYFRDMLRRDMNAKKPKRSSYAWHEEYAADSLRWANDELYGWLEKNRKADGSRYNLDKDGLRIYTTINARMQKYAEEAVTKHLAKDLQKQFNSELRYKNNPPFSNDIDADTRHSLIRQAQRWSDRWRNGKNSGLSEDEIIKSFDVPTKMTVFAWSKDAKNGGWKGISVDTTMTPNDSIKYYKSFLRAGFMAIEPLSGHVKAYVGGPNYRYFKYDNVSQGKRQVGSTVKPFVYSLAINEGLTPCDRVANVPQTFELPDGETWTPREANCGGILTLKEGITKSNNNISAFLMGQFGPESIVDMMKRMGISSHVDPVYSLCVGAADVSVKEMVTAYNTFPSQGVYTTPMFVTRIEDVNGNVITECNSQKHEVLSPEVTFTMIDMMESVVNAGTGHRLRAVFGLQGPIAGKTGTTNDNSDGWFIGYTPGITAGVWVGAEDRQIHFASTTLGQGANMALPIFGYFLEKCYSDPHIPLSPSDAFIIPKGVTPVGCGDGGGVYLGGDGAEQSGESDESEYYFN